MNTFTETIPKKGKIIPTRQPLSTEIKTSINNLIFSLVFLILVISITYLLNNSLSYQKGHVLRVEQIKQDQLIDQKNFLIEQINQIKSLRTLENTPIFKSMSKPESIIYLNKN